MPPIVIEFEPLVVGQLSERATRSLAFSALAGVFLLAGAGVLWRLIEKREEAQRRDEHERRLRALGFCRTRPLERREVDPAALVREIAESLGDSEVEIDAAAAPERWSLDPLRMRQALATW